MQILDRRLNPSGRSLPNRQRFLRRAKALVQEAVRDASAKRDIRSADAGGEVSIPLHGIREPSFHHGARRHPRPRAARQQGIPGGRRDPAPAERRWRGRLRRRAGRQRRGHLPLRPDAGGIPPLFLDDLELPDLAKRRLVEGSDPAWHRAGYSVAGTPSNLSLARTMRNSLSRRIALKRPKPAEVLALEAEIAALEGDAEAAERLVTLQGRAGDPDSSAASASPGSTRSTFATGGSSRCPARSPAPSCSA